MAPASMVLYCIAAGIFFAAAAYAQFNDPDPEWWIAAYLVGGCFFNILTVTYHDTPTEARIRPFVLRFATGNTIALLIWIHSLMFKLDYDLPLRQLAWSVLEYEEGREIGGLLLLLLHVLRIQGYLNKKKVATSAAKKDSSGLMETMLVAGILSGAAYLWINYQQVMNQRDNVDHCNGQFDGSGLLQGLFGQSTVHDES